MKKIPRQLAAALIRYFYQRDATVFPADVVASLFHRLYYQTPGTWIDNTFLGVRAMQSPFDLQLYQELVYALRPAFILQTGVASGGSILFFATLLDLVGADRDSIVIGVDVALTDSARRLRHPRVHLIEGDSVSPETLAQVRQLVGSRKGMVCLDSNHAKAHVASEIRAYREFVALGSYLVVEDTNIEHHGVCQGFGAGPRDAVEEFLRDDEDFVQDDALWQRNLVSFHEYGWLKRVRAASAPAGAS